MLEEKGKASPRSKGILLAGTGTCSCPALALQGVWDQGSAPRGAPILCTSRKELEESPAEQGWAGERLNYPQDPLGSSLPTLQPQLPLSTAMEDQRSSSLL